MRDAVVAFRFPSRARVNPQADSGRLRTVVLGGHAHAVLERGDFGLGHIHLSGARRGGGPPALRRLCQNKNKVRKPRIAPGRNAVNVAAVRDAENVYLGNARLGRERLERCADG